MDGRPSLTRGQNPAYRPTRPPPNSLTSTAAASGRKRRPARLVQRIPGPSRLPYWTVSNGGSYTSTGALTIRHQPGTSQTLITCDTVVSGAIADTTGPPRGNLGSVRLSFPRNCTGPDNTTWQVEQRGIAGFGAFKYNPATREVEGKVTNVSLQLTGNIPGVGSCTAVAIVHAPATYSNPPDPRLRIMRARPTQMAVGLKAPPAPPTSSTSQETFSSAPTTTSGPRRSLSPAPRVRGCGALRTPREVTAGLGVPPVDGGVRLEREGCSRRARGGRVAVCGY